MCWSQKVKRQEIKSVHNSNGKINEESNEATSDLPEHFDNAYLNRHVQTGILGFYYETRNTSFLVYLISRGKNFLHANEIETYA